MSGRLGEWPAAGDDRRIDRFCEGDVHGVVRADVVSQFPHTAQQIEVSVAVEIEVGEIRNGVRGTAGRHFAGPDETPEALNDLHVDEMRHMELVVPAKEPGLDANAKRCLQEKLEN